MAGEPTTLAVGIQDISLDGIQETPFPTHSKTVAGLVGGAETDVSSLAFSDKILITISQGGRLSQWVCYYRILYLYLDIVTNAE